MSAALLGAGAVGAERSAERLSIGVVIERRPFVTACNDAGELHLYEVVVASAEAPVPGRVVVRHRGETVLEASV